MADEVRNPHDKLFRAVFSDAAEAGSLMQMALPPGLREELDWGTLTLLEGTFLDDTLRESESDLLYEVEHSGSGERVWLYVLLEHQSTPDGWMRFRLLKYCCRIWDASLREGAALTGEAGLRPIVPLVFYQGRDGWRHSREFADLFPVELRRWPWVPRFEHLLLDATGLEPGGVGGGERGRVAQLLMMAAFDRHLREALEQAARLVSSLPVAGGMNYVRVFIRYVMATQERETVEAFGEALRRHGREQGGEIMSYAQQLLQEGRQEGWQEGRQEGWQGGREEGERPRHGEGG